MEGVGRICPLGSLGGGLFQMFVSQCDFRGSGFQFLVKQASRQSYCICQVCMYICVTGWSVGVDVASNAHVAS